MAGGSGFCLHPAIFQAGQPRFTRAIAVKSSTSSDKANRSHTRYRLSSHLWDFFHGSKIIPITQLQATGFAGEILKGAGLQSVWDFDKIMFLGIFCKVVSK